MDNSSADEFRYFFTRNEKEQRGVKSIGFFVGGISLFQMLLKSETRLPKLVCHELAFAFTLSFN